MCLRWGVAMRGELLGLERRRRWSDEEKIGIVIDLLPEAPSFITRVCVFGFHILRRQFGQARRL